MTVVSDLPRKDRQSVPEKVSRGNLGLLITFLTAECETSKVGFLKGEGRMSTAKVATSVRRSLRPERATSPEAGKGCSLFPHPFIAADVIGDEIFYLLREGERARARAEEAASAPVIGQPASRLFLSPGGRCSGSKRPPVSWITSQVS